MGGSRIITGIFLQARLYSRRLPHKALLTLHGINVLQHAMRALKNVKAQVYALLTDKESAKTLKIFAQTEGFKFFIGPTADVLKRFCLAAEHFSVTRVVRATGDNPLVSARLTGQNLLIHDREQVDLSRFRGEPLGTGVEVIETKALLKTQTDSKDSYEHEHITTHILRNEDKYKVLEIQCPADCYYPQARVTLDTEDDYRFLQLIYQELYKDKPIETDKLVKWLKKYKKPLKKNLHREKYLLSPQ